MVLYWTKRRAKHFQRGVQGNVADADHVGAQAAEWPASSSQNTAEGKQIRSACLPAPLHSGQRQQGGTEEHRRGGGCEVEVEAMACEMMLLCVMS